MSPKHLDDFTLLRYAALDLDGPQRDEVEEHLRGCGKCADVLGTLEELNKEMKEVAKAYTPEDGLPPGDPFAKRPQAPPRPRGGVRREPKSLAMTALEASQPAGAESSRILEAARRGGELTPFFSTLSFSDLTTRFAVLYALQEAAHSIAENPPRCLALALATLARLDGEAEDGGSPNGRILPLEALAAQAHLLAGQGRTWTGELEKAGEHLEEAYRAFGASTGDDFSLAIVELGESQRRAFEGDPATGLPLASRALATFQEMGLEDFAARAQVAVATCLSKIGRETEAIEACRSALPVFEKHGLWSNYVGAVNALGSCLSAIGKLDEARREYARALRVVSREKHAAWVGYIRNNLALVLFRAGDFRAAALAFLQAANLFRESGSLGNALTASLYEIESWALSGDSVRAAQRFEVFRAEVVRHDALDPAIVRQLESLLSGHDPGLEEVALLRQSAHRTLQERLEKKLG